MAHVRRREQFHQSPARTAAPLRSLVEPDAAAPTASRRRSMALLKYGSGSATKAPRRNLSKTRAHARELAQTMSKDQGNALSPTGEADDFFADFGSAFGSSQPSAAAPSKPQTDSFADFGSPDAFAAATPVRSSSQRQQQHSTPLTTNSRPSHRSRRGTAETATPERRQAAEEAHFSVMEWPDESSNSNHNINNSSNWQSSQTPSRSRRGTKTLQQKLESTAAALPTEGSSSVASSTMGSANHNAAVALQRRRLRNQAHQQQQPQQHYPESHPESPKGSHTIAAAAPSASSSSIGSNSNATPQPQRRRRRLANHVAHYQKTSVPRMPAQRAPSVSSNTTTRSTTSCSTTNSDNNHNVANHRTNANSSSNNNNQTSSSGFTFDAFGLDAQDFTKVADITDDYGEFALQWDDQSSNATRSSSPPSPEPQQAPKSWQREATASRPQHNHSINSSSINQNSINTSMQSNTSSSSPQIFTNRRMAEAEMTLDQETDSDDAMSSSSSAPEPVPRQQQPQNQPRIVMDDVLARTDTEEEANYNNHQQQQQREEERVHRGPLNSAEQPAAHSYGRQTTAHQRYNPSGGGVVPTTKAPERQEAPASQRRRPWERPSQQPSESRPTPVPSSSYRSKNDVPSIHDSAVQGTSESMTSLDHEEKKEEERALPPAADNPSIGSLKARFERNQAAAAAAAPVVPKPFSRTKPLPKLEIQNIETQLGHELMSPEKVAAQKQREKQQQQQQSSAMRYAKSEGGANIRHHHVSQVLRNIKGMSPPQASPRDEEGGDTNNFNSHRMEAKSDVGVSTPRSPFGVTLRKTGLQRDSTDSMSVKQPAPVYRSSPERSEPQSAVPVEPVVPQRKLTYRERRELELQKQRQEEPVVKEEPAATPDVRELIRNRIAANKKRLSDPEQPQPQEESHAEQTYTEPTPTIQLSASHDRAKSPQPLTPRRLRQTELIIEEQNDDESAAASEVAPAKPSAAVSHMLMLQHLQQRQPPVSPIRTQALPSPKQAGAVPSPARSRGGLSVDTDTDRQSRGSAGKATTPKATMMMLNAFLAGRGAIPSANQPDGKGVDDSDVIDFDQGNSPTAAGSAPASGPATTALKDDPTYERYFKMLKIGMPVEVVKHAMVRDGLDPSIMDGDDGDAPGVPLKDDPTYKKYFKMLSIGMPMEAVKHAMQRDGLDSTVMDQDHNQPVQKPGKSQTEAPKEKDSHRRARLHWKTVRKVTSNSLWAQIDADEALENLQIDETEFQELFQAEKGEIAAPKATNAVSDKRGASVRVIDPKRANNGGIILARLKMSHDDMADAVDRINENALTAEQIENIIEYLPTKEERKALEAYMLEGGQDAGEKFESLCECEKFMVSMMTVKHAKLKVRALLFRLQFETCIKDIQQDTLSVEAACDELKKSQRLRTLLGYILTFGNRLNTAGNGRRKAGAFTLDSLLKLNQAKAFDKKTTFLQYIVQIVLRNDEELTHFKDDLPSVFKADRVYWDQCLTDLEELENQLENVRRISLYQARQAQQMYRIRRKKNNGDENEELSEDDVSLTLEEEVEALRSTPIGLFTLSAIKYVSAMRDKVEETRAKYASLLEYFGEDGEQMQPHELFNIIVAFSRDFVKATEQVLANEKKKLREKKSTAGNTRKGKPPVHSSPVPTERPIRASNHQPSMGSILKELKTRPRDTSESATKTHRRQQSNGDIQPASPTENGYEAYSTPDRTASRARLHQAASNGDDRPDAMRPPQNPMLSVAQAAAARAASKSKTVNEPPPESAPMNLAPVTPRSMAAVRAKARIRRQRAASREVLPKSHHLPDDASTDAPLSPRATVGQRKNVDLRHQNSQSSSDSNLEQALELD